MEGIEKVTKGLCEAIGIIHGHVRKRYWGYGEQACRDAIELLKEQPKIVRCKDCKHRPEVKERKIYGRVEKYPVFPEDSICPACNTSDSYYSWIPDDNWFCADGELKEKEGKRKPGAEPGRQCRRTNWTGGKEHGDAGKG